MIKLTHDIFFSNCNYCPRLTKLVRGLWNGLPYVCVSVRCPSVRAQNFKVCFFSVIFWPILILFVLSDRAWCGLQNCLHRILKFINYANLFKIMKNATSLSFLGRFWFCLFYLIGLGAGFKTTTQNFWNSLIMQIIQNQWKMLLLCHFLTDFDSVCYLIGLGAASKLVDRILNSLIMQNLFKSMKNATSLSFLGRFWFCLFYLIGLGAGFKTSTQNFEIH